MQCANFRKYGNFLLRIVVVHRNSLSMLLSLWLSRFSCCNKLFICVSLFITLPHCCFVIVLLWACARFSPPILHCEKDTMQNCQWKCYLQVLYMVHWNFFGPRIINNVLAHLFEQKIRQKCDARMQHCYCNTFIGAFFSVHTMHSDCSIIPILILHAVFTFW